MQRSDNPLRDFRYWSEMQEEWLNSRPICDECGMPIQKDRYYEIEGKKYCPDCIELAMKFID